MADTLDLIGAGMAGVNAARKCAQAGWSVAIADELPYGGTCAPRGCDLKKLLHAGAEAVEAARRLSGKGVTGETRIDRPALMRHKESFTDPMPERMKGGLRKASCAPCMVGSASSPKTGLRWTAKARSPFTR